MRPSTAWELVLIILGCVIFWGLVTVFLIWAAVHR